MSQHACNYRFAVFFHIIIKLSLIIVAHYTHYPANPTIGGIEQAPEWTCGRDRAADKENLQFP